MYCCFDVGCAAAAVAAVDVLVEIDVCVELLTQDTTEVAVDACEKEWRETEVGQEPQPFLFCFSNFLLHSPS